MAGADYRSCDVCSGKTFYDANLNYEFKRNADDGIVPHKEVGKPSHLMLYGLGDWAVLCIDCSAKFKTQIVPIDQP